MNSASKVNLVFGDLRENGKGLELRVVISAIINSTIANILSPNLTLYDLQKPRYELTNMVKSRRRPKKGVAVFCKTLQEQIMAPHRGCSVASK